jgi:hypothetical protein
MAATYRHNIFLRWSATSPFSCKSKPLVTRWKINSVVRGFTPTSLHSTSEGGSYQLAPSQLFQLSRDTVQDHVMTADGLPEDVHEPDSEEAAVSLTRNANPYSFQAGLVSITP